MIFNARATATLNPPAGSGSCFGLVAIAELQRRPMSETAEDRRQFYRFIHLPELHDALLKAGGDREVPWLDQDVAASFGVGLGAQ